MAAAGKDFDITDRHKPLRIKPGSAGKPTPGFDVRVVDDNGNEIERGTMGNIVLAVPLAPTAFTTLWRDEERFYKGYLKRFSGRWLDTGDAGMIDQDGYVHVMSRSDDIINVAAHRFSTGKLPKLSCYAQGGVLLLTLNGGAIEQAITSHREVAEACVVGIPDALKGQLPFAFTVLATANHPAPSVVDQQLLREVQSLVRDQIGPIASLGGMIQGKGMIPKTRSGKTLRRVLKELLENAVHGNFDKAVQVPATVEDSAVVEVARTKIREYFSQKSQEHAATEQRAKL